MNAFTWRNTPSGDGLTLLNASGAQVKDDDGNNVQVSFAEAEARGLEMMGVPDEAPAPDPPLSSAPPPRDAGARSSVRGVSSHDNKTNISEADSSGLGEPPESENASGGDDRGLSEIEQAAADEVSHLLMTGLNENFSDRKGSLPGIPRLASLRDGSALANLIQAKSKEEIAAAEKAAGVLAIRLEGGRDDEAGMISDTERLASSDETFPLSGIGNLLFILGLVYGADRLKDALKSNKAKRHETDSSEAVEIANRGKRAPRLEVKSEEGKNKYYEMLSEEWIRFWTKPLESRGNKTTKRGNDIVVQECNAILEAEYPGLKTFDIKHIGGGTERGRGIDKVTEAHLPRLGDPEPGKSKRSGFSRADITYGRSDAKGKRIRGGIEAHGNTADMRKDGTLTTRERLSLERLLRNAGGRLAAALPKFKGNSKEDEEKYRREVREACRAIFDDLDRQLKELKKQGDKQDQTGENDDDDAQPD